MEQLIKNNTSTQKGLDYLFDTLIETLKKDQEEIKYGIAAPEKEKFYTGLMNFSDETAYEIKEKVSFQLLRIAVLEYGARINNASNQPLKVALNYTNDKILVFAIISDGDEEAENLLLRVEAEINYKFQNCGIYVSTTILEEEDNYSIPEYYKLFIDNGKIQ